MDTRSTRSCRITWEHDQGSASKEASAAPRRICRGALKEEALSVRRHRADTQGAEGDVSALQETSMSSKRTRGEGDLDVFSSPFRALAESCGFKVIRDDEGSCCSDVNSERSVAGSYSDACSLRLDNDRHCANSGDQNGSCTSKEGLVSVRTRRSTPGVDVSAQRRAQRTPDVETSCDDDEDVRDGVTRCQTGGSSRQRSYRLKRQESDHSGQGLENEPSGSSRKEHKRTVTNRPGTHRNATGSGRYKEMLDGAKDQVEMRQTSQGKRIHYFSERKMTHSKGIIEDRISRKEINDNHHASKTLQNHKEDESTRQNGDPRRIGSDHTYTDSPSLHDDRSDTGTCRTVRVGPPTEHADKVTYGPGPSSSCHYEREHNSRDRSHGSSPRKRGEPNLNSSARSRDETGHEQTDLASRRQPKVFMKRLQDPHSANNDEHGAGSNTHERPESGIRSVDSEAGNACCNDETAYQSEQIRGGLPSDSRVDLKRLSHADKVTFKGVSRSGASNAFRISRRSTGSNCGVMRYFRSGPEKVKVKLPDEEPSIFSQIQAECHSERFVRKDAAFCGGGDGNVPVNIGKEAVSDVKYESQRHEPHRCTSDASFTKRSQHISKEQCGLQDVAKPDHFKRVIKDTDHGNPEEELFSEIAKIKGQAFRVRTTSERSKDEDKVPHAVRHFDCGQESLNSDVENWKQGQAQDTTTHNHGGCHRTAKQHVTPSASYCEDQNMSEQVPSDHPTEASNCIHLHGYKEDYSPETPGKLVVDQLQPNMYKTREQCGTCQREQGRRDEMDVSKPTPKPRPNPTRDISERYDNDYTTHQHTRCDVTQPPQHQHSRAACMNETTNQQASHQVSQQASQQESQQVTENYSAEHNKHQPHGPATTDPRISTDNHLKSDPTYVPSTSVSVNITNQVTGMLNALEKSRLGAPVDASHNHHPLLHHHKGFNINSNYEGGEEGEGGVPGSRFIGQYFLELWKNQCLCDVRLRVGNWSYLAHKVVLAAFSDFFCPSDPHCLPSICFDIPNATPDAVHQILLYLYTSEMEITDYTLESVLCAAESLGVSEVINLVKEILDNPTPENFEHYLEIRARHGFSARLTDYHDLIREHLLDLTQSTYFLELDQGDLQALLADPEVKVDSECDIIELIARWVEYSPLDRIAYSADLLSFVNFDCIPADSLADVVERKRHVFSRDAFSLFLNAFKNRSISAECPPCPQSQTMMLQSYNNSTPRRSYYATNTSTNADTFRPTQQQQPPHYYDVCENNRAPITTYQNQPENGRAAPQRREPTARMPRATQSRMARPTSAQNPGCQSGQSWVSDTQQSRPSSHASSRAPSEPSYSRPSSAGGGGGGQKRFATTQNRMPTPREIMSMACRGDGETSAWTRPGKQHRVTRVSGVGGNYSIGPSKGSSAYRCSNGNAIFSPYTGAPHDADVPPSATASVSAVGVNPLWEDGTMVAPTSPGFRYPARPTSPGWSRGSSVAASPWPSPGMGTSNDQPPGCSTFRVVRGGRGPRWEQRSRSPGSGGHSGSRDRSASKRVTFM